MGTAGISLRQHRLFDRLEGGAQDLIDHLHRHEGHGLPHVVGEFIEVTLIAFGQDDGAEPGAFDPVEQFV